MMVSTRGRYALRVMIELASSPPDVFVPLKEIAEREEISTKYLEAILATLSKAGMVVGLRGKGGGYQLSRPPEQYTVGSILKQTEGSLAPVACLEDGFTPCRRAEECPTLPMWTRLGELIDEYLEGVTLADLTAQRKALAAESAAH